MVTRPRCIAPALSTLSSSAMHAPLISSTIAATPSTDFFMMPSRPALRAGWGSLAACPGRRHMDARGGHDLGPECDGEAGQDHHQGAEQGLGAGAAGRIFVAMTIDIGHRAISQNERRPRGPLTIVEITHDLQFSIPSHTRRKCRVERLSASHDPGGVRIFRRHDLGLDLNADVLAYVHDLAGSIVADLPDREVIGAL